VARAKKTDRAEARRRHRIALAAEGGITLDDEELDDVDVSPPAARATPVRGRPGPADPASPRPVGITAAFRTALRPANVRDDIRYLPDLILHTKAVWLPTLLVVLVVASLFVPGLDQISGLAPVRALVAQTVLVPPSLIAPFLAGMLAPRAAYLAGAIAGLVTGIAFIASIGALIAISGTGTSATEALNAQSVGYSLVLSPLFGLFVGAFAGFYRRFLRMSGPRAASQNRGRKVDGRARRR
jgi:hypothetical protein